MCLYLACKSFADLYGRCRDATEDKSLAAFYYLVSCASVAVSILALYLTGML
jgi:hypothetical protein